MASGLCDVRVTPASLKGNVCLCCGVPAPFLLRTTLTSAWQGLAQIGMQCDGREVPASTVLLPTPAFRAGCWHQAPPAPAGPWDSAVLCLPLPMTNESSGKSCSCLYTSSSTNLFLPQKIWPLSLLTLFSIRSRKDVTKCRWDKALGNHILLFHFQRTPFSSSIPTDFPSLPEIPPASSSSVCCFSSSKAPSRAACWLRRATQNEFLVPSSETIAAPSLHFDSDFSLPFGSRCLPCHAALPPELRAQKGERRAPAKMCEAATSQI